VAQAAKASPSTSIHTNADEAVVPLRLSATDELGLSHEWAYPKRPNWATELRSLHSIDSRYGKQIKQCVEAATRATTCKAVIKKLQDTLKRGIFNERRAGKTKQMVRQLLKDYYEPCWDDIDFNPTYARTRRKEPPPPPPASKQQDSTQEGPNGGSELALLLSRLAARGADSEKLELSVVVDEQVPVHNRITKDLTASLNNRCTGNPFDRRVRRHCDP
jgi:hypothetical protein